VGPGIGDISLIGQDRIGNFTLSDSPDYLFVGQATGAATLIDTELWLSDPAMNLPDPIQAETIAIQLLSDLGRLPRMFLELRSGGSEVHWPKTSPVLIREAFRITTSRLVSDVHSKAFRLQDQVQRSPSF
jgi:hypothetical protein